MVEAISFEGIRDRKVGIAFEIRREAVRPEPHAIAHRSRVLRIRLGPTHRCDEVAAVHFC